MIAAEADNTGHVPPPHAAPARPPGAHPSGPCRPGPPLPRAGAALAAGALPVFAFPAPGLATLAWVALVPGLLLMQRAPSAREAAVRGWWFGAGFILTGMYWLIPSIGPALPLLAVVFGVLQAGVGLAVHRLLHPPLTARRALLALAVVPAVWLTTEYARSWHALGGPWALLGATQWRHPAVLALASAGGIWLVSAAVVAVNTGVLIVLTATGWRPRALAALATVLVLAAGPLLFALRAAPMRRRSGHRGPGPARHRRGPAGPVRGECRRHRRPGRAAGRPDRLGREQHHRRPGARPGRRGPAEAGSPPSPAPRSWPGRTPARPTGGSPRTRCWSPRRDGRPLPQDPAGAVRRVHPAAPAAGLDHAASAGRRARTGPRGTRSTSSPPPTARGRRYRSGR